MNLKKIFKFFKMMYTVDKMLGNTKAKTNCAFAKLKNDYEYLNVTSGSGISLTLKCINDENMLDNKIMLSDNMRKKLEVCLSEHVEIEILNINKNIIDFLKFEIKLLGKFDVNLEIDLAEFESIVSLILKNIPINNNYSYIIESKGYILLINNLTNLDNEKKYFIDDNTKFEFIIDKNKFKNFKLIGNPTSKENFFNGNFNRENMNIGGLSEEFNIIFKKAFSTHLIPDDIQKSLGIKHVKGIILYGPPGCGKTLIARELGKIINCTEPSIVAGPSLLSKYIGESEQNVRKLFQPALDNPDKLHVVICDECDAIFKKRNSGDSAGNEVANNITNQFLSMIDGVNSLNNILLIGMTNNINAIDEAVIRPGRLELKICINLPDFKSRVEIFNVHLNKISASFKNNLDILKLAELSENFTGAEIESVVGFAKSTAISREINPENLNEIKKNSKKILITQEDLESSIKDITPMFGFKSREIEIVTAKDFLRDENYENFISELSCAFFGNTNIFFTNKGVKFACNAAKDTEKGCIKFINSETLVNCNRSIKLYDIITDATKVNTSTIILDNIEKIIKYNPLVGNCDNDVLQIIYILMEKILESNNRINLIITTENEELLNKLFVVNTIF